jgi:hypothetical protein
MADYKRLVLRYDWDRSITILVNGIERPTSLAAVRKLVYRGVHFEGCKTVSPQNPALCDDCVARIDKHEGFNGEVERALDGEVASTAAIGRWLRKHSKRSAPSSRV